MDTIAATAVVALLIQVSIFLVLFGILILWRLFTKAGQPGVSAVIPVYNIYLLVRIAGKPGWWTFLIFTPLIVVALPVVLLNLGKSFGKPAQYGLFPPLLADGNAKYVGSFPGDRNLAPSPMRGAFLTSVLLYLLFRFSTGAIMGLLGQELITALLLLVLFSLTYAVWRGTDRVLPILLTVWAITAALNYFLFVPGVFSTTAVVAGLAGDVLFALLLVFAIPIGRRLALAPAAPQVAAVQTSRAG